MLKDKKILVVGATGAIGEAVVEMLSKENATIIASYSSSKDKAESLKIVNEKIHIINLNLSDINLVFI